MSNEKPALAPLNAVTVYPSRAGGFPAASFWSIVDAIQYQRSVSSTDTPCGICECPASSYWRHYPDTLSLPRLQRQGEIDSRAWAASMHAGQNRKYTGEPYIIHAAAVVELVRSVPHTEAMLITAWLHPRAARDRTHLAMASAYAQTVKLADIIDNCSTVAERDPSFAKTYIAEKRSILEVLTLGDPKLKHHAETVLQDAENWLEASA